MFRTINAIYLIHCGEISLSKNHVRLIYFPFVLHLQLEIGCSQ